MGNASSPAPNQVDVFQRGGCSGGGSCGFAAPQFDTGMDPRLSPYLTQEEYSSVISNANNLLKRRAPTCKVMLCIVPMVLAAMVCMFVAIANPPKYRCQAANGLCRTGQNPVTNDCCLAKCCAHRRLIELDDFEEPKLVSGRMLQKDSLQETYLNSTPANPGASPVQMSGQDAPRSLLSRRMGRSLQSCKQIQDGDPDNIVAECMCRQSGKNRKCDGSVSVEGKAEKSDGLRWMLGLAIPLHVVGVLGPLTYTIGFNCALPGLINPLLEPWVQKGLQAHYRMGSKHSQARISVFTPQTGMAVVGKIEPQTMQVQVPEGAGPGTLLQVASPAGQPMQVKVPDGVQPGGMFTMQC